ncbi:serine hydrolase domain-containing protein [Sphingoaurantiacus capsulatus]|uniref:Serine hydrolase domain-containing protein n=1 Tax=Sphingoaurantiacus capsulatus TaxID=1771310 RepID=A0ABV7X7C2_9SPHN
MRKGLGRGKWLVFGSAVALALIAVAALIYAALQRSPTLTDGVPAIRKPVGLSADPEPGPTAVDYARLDARIRLLMLQPDMVGFAIGTVEKGKVRFVRGYGEVLAGSGEAVTPDTVFRWGSVSKGVASSLVVKLAEEGRLSLDAPIASMGTTLTLPGKSAKLSIADVLSHRVGIVKNAWDDRLERGEDPKQIRRELGTLPAYCPPSTCYQYQNISFDAATEVIEGLTAQRYATVAHDRLFAPLGMTSASVDRHGLETAKSWARPHRMAREITSVNDIYYGVPAAGGVNSSIRDLVKWMRAQMGAAPAVLSPAALETLHRPRIYTPPHGRRSDMDKALKDAHYGLGWRSFTYQGHHLVGHRGFVDGYGSLMLFDPKDQSGIVMLWNSNWGRGSRLQLEFFDHLYGLPPTDWLEVPGSKLPPAPPPAGNSR